jgi:hypothetical protein
MRHARWWIVGAGLGIAAFFIFLPSSNSKEGEALDSFSKQEKAAIAKDSQSPVPKRSLSGKIGGILTLSLLDASGALLRGRLSWVQSDRPPLGPRLLLNLPHLRKVKGLPRIKERVIDGKPLVLSFQKPQWTWLKVEGKDLKGDSFFMYRMIPPFEGSARVSLLFHPKKTKIHAFLMGVDGSDAVGDQEITLFEGPATGPGALIRKELKRTNAFGYAAFEAERGKGYLLQAPGAVLDDNPPFTSRVLFPKGMGAHDVLVALAPQKKRQKVLFDLTLPKDFQISGRRPKVFLRSLDSKEKHRLFSQAVLRPGKNSVFISAPPGKYQAYILPYGLLKIPSQFHSFVVPEKEDLVLRAKLTPNDEKTFVTFLGVLNHAGPFYVYPRFEKDPQGIEEQPGFAFLGRFRWHEPEGSVSLPQRPFRFVLLSAGTCSLSKQLFRPPFPPRLNVELVQATLVELSVDPEHPQLKKAEGCLDVLVEDSLGILKHSLKRSIQRVGGDSVIRLRASIVVPRKDQVTFRIVDRETGGILFVKKFQGLSELAHLEF